MKDDITEIASCSLNICGKTIDFKMLCKYSEIEYLIHAAWFV